MTTPADILAKCSVCGHITNDFVRYGSTFLVDEYPQECPCVCSDECMAAASDLIMSGKWRVPVLRKSCGGYAHDIKKPRKGYDRQPTQAELIKAILPAKA